MPTYSVDAQYIGVPNMDIDNPYLARELIEGRFEDTIGKAEELYQLLVGPDGTSGVLGAMQAAISSAPTTTITAPSVDTSLTLETSGQSVPSFDRDELQSYPTRTISSPSLSSIPTIDSDFEAVAEPDDVSVVMAWSEAALDSTVYDEILDRMLTDLQSGATGLAPDVEVAIYDRARTRQQADNLANYNTLVNNAAQMQFQFPSGVLASALVDYGIGEARQTADIENQIIVAQADLAQKNSQFMMQQAIALEGLIRSTREGESNRALDGAKTLAGYVVEDFKNRVTKYVSIWEARKVKVQAQAETLRGVIDSNRGLIDIFAKEYDALKTEIDAVTAYNKGLTDTFIGEVQGFGEVERAVSSRNDSRVKLLGEQLKNADMTLRAAIASAESAISGYTAESSVKEKFSNDIAQIIAHVIASMMSAVHVGATAGYNGSESASKSINVSAGVHESHNAEHDPAA